MTPWWCCQEDPCAGNMSPSCCRHIPDSTVGSPSGKWDPTWGTVPVAIGQTVRNRWCVLLVLPCLIYLYQWTFQDRYGALVDTSAPALPSSQVESRWLLRYVHFRPGWAGSPCGLDAQEIPSRSPCSLHCYPMLTVGFSSSIWQCCPQILHPRLIFASWVFDGLQWTSFSSLNVSFPSPAGAPLNPGFHGMCVMPPQLAQARHCCTAFPNHCVVGIVD